MKLRLERMGKPYNKQPLVAPKLFEGVWKIGEVKEREDKNAYDILSKFPDLFTVVKDEPVQNKMVQKPAQTAAYPSQDEIVLRQKGRPRKTER